MAARQQTSGGQAPPPFDMNDPAGAFDFASLQNVLNDPSIKAMAEKLAQDPSFAQMTQSLQSGMAFGGQPSEAHQQAAGPAMDPRAASDAMQAMFQNPEFMHMAQELGQKIMQTDPGMQEMMTAMQRPDFQEVMNERLKKMKDDPEIAKMVEDVEARGPGAMMSYWSDPVMLEKMSRVMGDVFSEGERGAGPLYADADGGSDDAEETDADGEMSALHAAASKGDEKRVQQLLEEGADVEEQDSEGRTALQFACGYGEIACAEALLKAKASVEAVDGNGNTALHYAAGYNEPKGVALLLKHNADKTKKNADGKTALEVAEINENPEVCELLQD